VSKEKIHFLGICGTFMGGLALLAREKGYQVSGCDMNIYPPMSDLLRKEGIDITPGYSLKDLPEADTFIIGNALSRGNELVEYLLERKENIISGPDWMAKNILNKRKVLAISGTHGKTTTSSMAAWILECQNIDAGFLIAGKPKNFHSSSRLGSHEIFVVEADEYDTAFFDKRAKFIHYKPHVLVINNIEFDHADIYENLNSIQTQFHHLVRTIPKGGSIIYPDFDSNIEETLERGCWSKKITYGNNLLSMWKIEALEEDFSMFEIQNDKEFYKIKWNLIGEHNAQNAISAIIACFELGVKIEDSCRALSLFRGVTRRLDLIYQTNDLSIYDDFAHHPTAIKKTLEGLRSSFSDSRIIALIEMRSNTMKSGLHDEELNEACKLADLLFWKSEDQEQEKKLIKMNPKKSNRITNEKKFIENFIKQLKPNDIVVLMSNGNFLSLGDKLIERLSKV